MIGHSNYITGLNHVKTMQTEMRVRYRQLLSQLPDNLSDVYEEEPVAHGFGIFKQTIKSLKGDVEGTRRECQSLFQQISSTDAVLFREQVIKFYLSKYSNAEALAAADWIYEQIGVAQNLPITVEQLEQGMFNYQKI